MYYSQQQLTEFDGELATILDKCQVLLTGYFGRRYLTARGNEFAVQGFLRRLGTLQHCIQRVFTLLPPAIEGIPSTETREDATIALQAFIFNVFGCMDNLAWVWVELVLVSWTGRQLS